jgi:uncharacterized membrane protein
MNPIQLHLAINHFPLVGLLFTFVLLLVGVRRGNREIIRLSYVFLIIVGVAAAVAYLSGEPAEELVEHAAGFAEEAIEQHEEASKFGLIAGIIVGVMAIAGLAFKKGSLVASKNFNRALLVVLVWALAVMAQVSRLGGKIRHTEIDNPPSAEAKP